MQISHFSEILKKFAHAGRFRKEFKMKKLLKWLFVKEKQEPEYFFEPVWTPYEENERKYEARKKREQELLAKYGNR